MVSGQAVISKPVCTRSKPSESCRKKGSATYASICAQNDAIDVQIDSPKIGMRSRSSGNSGTGWVRWRRTKTVPMTIAAATSSATSQRA